VAKQRRRYCASHALATVIGLALMGLDAFGSWEAQLKEAGQVTYIVLAAPVIATAACFLLLLAERARSEGHPWKAAALVVAFLFAGSVVVMAALERTAGAQDRALATRQTANQPVTLARGALKSAEQALAKAEAAASAECATGAGRRCRALVAREDAARQRVANSRAALTQVGVVVAENPRAKALAALLPISEATIGLYAPAVVPLAMLTVGLACIWYGIPHQVPEPEKVRARKRPRRRAPRPRPAPTAARGDNVIPLKAANEN